MGVLETIFGSGKVIEKGLDLIDDAWTSDEEQAQMDNETRKQKAQTKIDLMKAYAPFRIAQRYLAFMFAGNFLMSFWVAVILWSWDRDMEGFLDIMAAFNLGWIMTAIVLFYFGGGLTDSVGSAIKKNKVK